MNNLLWREGCVEAVAWRCSLKKVFLEISQIFEKISSACNFIKKETLAQVFSCEFCKISENTYSHTYYDYFLLCRLQKEFDRW